ncbi:Histone-lysine N-methyltransferase, H3 lysine-79 specific [Caenorhabditis elegans]|uniref:Histone-lysine N-methyltransferase, H3 lysine-79 specific n=1 Tax=Caenorhabditis elegans TaxID=6239 RepID=Q23200_CAEEL|nr:Histone-lysine N-methyltransferase, H3 lysine-79 specific [Caenorhabditis elegans]CAA93538.3 Histone-lysine N-methyltransferase, H3 lysine-79 specific [Caenorhabditis elegans]|eukprot:NP_001333541.1 Histone-lysine N-methyltransferase, H3 lysine-79 specific [Caenorhabditis elegans]
MPVIHLSSARKGNAEFKFPNTLHFRQTVKEMFEEIYKPILDAVKVPLPSDAVVGNPDKFSQYIDALNLKLAHPDVLSRVPAKHHEITSTRLCSLTVAIKLAELAYRFSVPDANVLRHYAVGTSTVYGELHCSQMASFVDQLNMGPSDYFMDLGSGIGHLVNFVAAYARTQMSVGVELMDNLAEIAEKNKEFNERLLNHFGKKVYATRFIHGSFTSPAVIREIQTKATVILANNVRFDPELKLQLKEILMGCKDRTRIISSEPLVPSRARQTNSRRADDFVKISDESLLNLVDNNVSWTSRKVPFYLTTINRNK